LPPSRPCPPPFASFPLEPLVPDYDFTLKMVGTGPEAETLRERYAGQGWISFTGHVPADQVPEIMADSDLLFVPSIWLENSPGVVIQALGLSLPVMGCEPGRHLASLRQLVQKSWYFLCFHNPGAKTLTRAQLFLLLTYICVAALDATAQCGETTGNGLTEWQPGGCRKKPSIYTISIQDMSTKFILVSLVFVELHQVESGIPVP